MSSDRSVTRREFVGAVGATTLVAGMPGIAPAGVGANDKIRLAIVGAGSRGNQLLGTFFGFPEAEFIAVADVDDHHAGQTADRLEKQYGKRPSTTRDYRSILDNKDVDAVVVATPDHWHVIPSIHAIQA